MLPALVLVPWLGKAFHIDDAQFLIYARLIAEQPLNPYTQVFEWDSMRVAVIDFPHPLLWQYALSGVRAVFGESEVAMHALTLACAALALWSLRGLAERLDVPALPACVLLAGSSAFSVMGSTIMPDLAATALSLASLERVVAALEDDRAGAAVCAGLLAGGAFLTRFTAAFSVGLLVAYPLLRRRRDPGAYTPFAIALAVVGASEWISFMLAGRPHFWSSLFQWSSAGGLTRDLRFAFDEVTFLGAQLPISGLVAYALWSRGRSSGIALILAALVVSCAALFLAPEFELMWAAALFAWPGLALVFDALLRLGEGARHRFRATDARSALRWLLAATVVATTFATVRYEHVAVKYLLLPLPAAILLLLDALGGRTGIARRGVSLYLWVSCAVGLVTATAVAISDYRWANSYRDFVAEELSERPRPSGTLYHNVQWGLRHYVEKAGLVAYRGGGLGPDDELLLSATVPPNWDAAVPAEPAAQFEIGYPGPFALLSFEHRAGFYSNYWGSYPFVFAPQVRDTIVIVRGPTKGK
jgi:hypothetical protein